MRDKSDNEIKNINKELFSKIFNISKVNSAKLFKIKEKYFIGQISLIEKINKSINDEDVNNIIDAQLKLKNVIEKNSEIRKNILSKKFNLVEMNSFAQNNGLKIKDLTIDKLEKINDLSKAVVGEIFKTDDKKFNLISENTFNNNYIVYTISTKFKTFDKDTKDYDLYKTRAKLSYANDIFKIYDKNVNDKYKVEFNNKTINRIKNSF